MAASVLSELGVLGAAADSILFQRGYHTPPPPGSAAAAFGVLGDPTHGVDAVPAPPVLANAGQFYRFTKHMTTFSAALVAMGPAQRYEPNLQEPQA